MAVKRLKIPIYDEQFPHPGSESLRGAHTFYLSFGPT
ncbi:predicted protein [Botrytis cinerea T4]|uniref:Uncharacterized protein n=1 Tax=Botryotinia fuckeliana (strain T4) TaxID=999810 RepID=G2Y3T1_BOTF4|nr:predicted protein [Botrytis cinerea T4]